MERKIILSLCIVGVIMLVYIAGLGFSHIKFNEQLLQKVKYQNLEIKILYDKLELCEDIKFTDVKESVNVAPELMYISPVEYRKWWNEQQQIGKLNTRGQLK